jgi:hypothetical protein
MIVDRKGDIRRVNRQYILTVKIAFAPEKMQLISQAVSHAPSAVRTKLGRGKKNFLIIKSGADSL